MILKKGSDLQNNSLITLGHTHFFTSRLEYLDFPDKFLALLQFDVRTVVVRVECIYPAFYPLLCVTSLLEELKENVRL